MAARRKKHSLLSLVKNLPRLVVVLCHWLLFSLRDRLVEVRKFKSREKIFVDASFHGPGPNEVTGVCGIGIWIPQRRLAFALNVRAISSMEGETLAILAGAAAAEQLGITHHVIISDCSSAVKPAARAHWVLRPQQSSGLSTDLLFRAIRRMARLAGEHPAYAQIYVSMRKQDGVVVWQPREKNREADLASTIGSRVGHMGIKIADLRDQRQQLQSVLASFLNPLWPSPDSEVVRQQLRQGTRTVTLNGLLPLSVAGFRRKAGGLMSFLSDDLQSEGAA